MYVFLCRAGAAEGRVGDERRRAAARRFRDESAATTDGRGSPV